MDKDKVLKEILVCVEVSNEKRYLDCEQATEISQILNVEKIEIGRICDKNEIKIRGCQLGCF